MIRINVYVGKNDLDNGSPYKSGQHPIELAVARRLPKDVDAELWGQHIIFTRTIVSLPLPEKSDTEPTMTGRFERTSRYTPLLPKRVLSFTNTYPSSNDRPFRFSLDLPIDFA